MVAVYSNPLNLFNLTVKGTPTTSDYIPIGDAAVTGIPLKMATIGSLPTSGAAGALTLITNGSASNQASISFAQCFTSTYNMYLILIENLVLVTAAKYLQANFGYGATPTYSTSGYAGSTFYINSNYAAASSTTGTSAMDVYGSTPQMPNSSTSNASASIIISNANNASNYKGFFGQTSYQDASNRVTLGGPFWQWQNATVITSIEFQATSGNISTGDFYIYGYEK